jgi:eukaryotic-like serine/threonine-protein kinase
VEAAPEPRQLLAPGTMLDDKYRIERHIATGGMGAVYEGTHTKLRKRVAIKVLNPALSSGQMLERFHREAITASQIGHEGIAQVTDLGTSLQGEPFLVMEFLEGESLAERIKTAGPLPIEMACELGCAILSPLAAAHQAGIIHRDLKPDNVFLVRQSRGEVVKLLDFGISRTAGLEAEFRLTTTGLVLGTPYYMSPEQARGDTDITPAADIYAFGVMLYEMLVGGVPIRGDNYNQLMYRVMTGDYVRPSMKRPDVHPELEHLIVSAMALEPHHRPPSAAALEQALLAFCRPTFREHTIERMSARGIPHSGFGTPGPHYLTPPPAGFDPTVAAPTPNVAPLPSPKKGSGSIVVIAVIALVLIGGGGFAIWKAMDDGGTKPAPTTPAPTIAETPKPTPAEPPKQQPPVEPAKPATPSTITLHFAVEPAGATIKLDGQKVAGTEQVVDRDTTKHALQISAPGFVTHEEQLDYAESQRLVVQLKRVAGKAGPTQRPPGTKDNGKGDRIESESPYK